MHAKGSLSQNVPPEFALTAIRNPTEFGVPPYFKSTQELIEFVQQDLRKAGTPIATELADIIDRNVHSDR